MQFGRHPGTSLVQMACEGTNSVPCVCVLKVVRYDDGVAKCMFQDPSLASSFENTLAPLNLW